MVKRKPKNLVQKLSTQVVPACGVDSASKAELLKIMERLAIVRAESYNKLGSIRHWGMDWHKAYPEVRSFRSPESLNLPSKLMEWIVSDVAKAILAGQAATIANLKKHIWNRYKGEKNEKVRKQCLEKLKSTAFLDDSFLHRIVRKEFQRGHTFVGNQIVYQPDGYSCKRVNRHVYLLELAGLTRGKRIKIKVCSNRKISGQIRVVFDKNLEQFEIHFLVNFGEYTKDSGAINTEVGIDKGYTEAFIDSQGTEHGPGLGKLLTQKSNRITNKNRNRGKLFALSRNLKQHDPAKSARILKNNLTRKTENKRYNKDQSAIASLIGFASKSLFEEKFLKIYAEDLTQPIKNKRQSKAMSGKLNSWVKGYLRDSLEKWASWSNSTITEVAASYTSQVDSVTGTLLGKRDSDTFTRFTGVVLQADLNAALNILARGTDKEINRYMKADEIQAVLLRRTARFLKGLGKSLTDAVELGWLDPKHTKNSTFKELVNGS
ncbi:zinc ribbon domain-containing protein [Brasilonema sp. UFV-L1]|uniref:zinc ribbon domain-containing protein n=1 Tax=Brasilonema sp. UFV-L1 TaxID=2234130 RepID=UPI00145D0841|nr:zinc ribbon domain-containing protein [Brasilonema sp. UFV-L1]NMG06152.1 transposase [Brasilonema sp. UFV-L1]